MESTNVQVVESSITGVTVYRSGARIVREATLPALGAGKHQVRLEDLPLALKDGSVRVQVSPLGGDAAPVASGARIILAVPQRTIPEHELQVKLRVALQDERALELRLEYLDRLLAVVQKIPVPGRPKGEEGKPPPPMSVEHRLSLIAFGADTQGALANERAKINEDLRQAMALRLHLEQEWGWVSAQQKARPDEVRKALECELRCGGECSQAILRAEYLVPGAQWAPSYALRLMGDGSTGVLGLRAAVRQDSGEDWQGAEVTFSTAAPQSWVEVPELKALRIGRRQPPSNKLGWRPPPQNTGELYSDYDRAFRTQPAPPSAPPPPPGPIGGLQAALERQEEILAGMAGGEPEGEMVEEMSVEPMMAMEVDMEMDDMAVFDDETPVPSAPAMNAMMPPPSAAPSPVMQEAPVMSRSRSMLSFGSSAPKSAKGRGAPMKKEAYAPGVGGGGAPPPQGFEEEEEVVGDDLLNYDRLRIGAAGAERGKLRPIPEETLYREHLQTASGPKVDESLDVWGAVRGAVNRARSRASLPEGLVPPSDLEGFDYAYPADGRLMIPSDGSFHTVHLTEKSASPRSHYVVVPRETQDVFRMVDFDNPLESPLLEGPIDVYVDDRYLLTGRLSTTTKEGKVSLGLGVEQALKVARNTRFAEDTAGIMGGTRELTHGIAVELVNHTGRPAKVHVRERIPVAGKEDKDVEVRVIKVTPAWEEYRQEPQSLDGGHQWVVEVPAGETVTLDAEYVIAIPSKHELRGGNRRES